MNTYHPQISVIMPAYNVGPYIATAIDSVLAQSFHNWELIIVNDASTDDTEAVIQGYSDPRIRYISSTKLGKPSKVRNVGLSLARGEFVTFLDSDDAYYPQALETLLAPFSERPGLNAVTAFPYYCDSQLKPIHSPPELLQNMDKTFTFNPGYALTWQAICAQEIAFFLSALMIRRSVAAQLGPLDENLTTSEDFKYYIQLFQLGFEKVQVLPVCTYLYRNHKSSVTKDALRTYNDLDNHATVVDWLFNQPFITPELQALKGHNLCVRWSAAAMLLTLANRSDLAWKTLTRALGHPDIGPALWLKYFGKHVVRLCIPHSVLMYCMTRLKRQTYLYFNESLSPSAA
jgi:glycosyltransferase involved in cell wall biosynthesis